VAESKVLSAAIAVGEAEIRNVAKRRAAVEAVEAERTWERGVQALKRIGNVAGVEAGVATTKRKCRSAAQVAREAAAARGALRRRSHRTEAIVP
jgi:hypothetical protein